MSDEVSSGAASGRPASLGPQESAADGGQTERPPSPRLECGCGHDRTHYLVSPVATYTRWGTFWVIFVGVSTKPVRVDFKCRQCGRLFDFTEDSVELGQFI
jgi:hypothetical protein